MKHFFLALFGSFALLSAWGLTSARHPAYSTFTCRARLLEPYVGDAAQALAGQIQGGAVNPIALFAGLGVPEDEFHALATAWSACGPESAPSGEPS